MVVCMQKLFRRWLALTFLTLTLLVGGCLPQQSSQSTSASPTSDPAGSATGNPTPTQIASRPDTPTENNQPTNLPRLDGKATIELMVKGNPITIEVDGTNAPFTAGNFVDLVRRGVYNGLSFHRVVREPQPFVVQGGDPQSKDPKFPTAQLGTGSFVDPASSQARYIPLEIKPEGADQPIYHQTLDSAGVTKAPKLRHRRGAVAMARSSMPDSASSQFYIALADLSFLDGSYAVFGYVTKGMETVDKIQQGDRIQTAKVVSGLDNLKQK